MNKIFHCKNAWYVLSMYECITYIMELIFSYLLLSSRMTVLQIFFGSEHTMWSVHMWNTLKTLVALFLLYPNRAWTPFQLSRSTISAHNPYTSHIVNIICVVIKGFCCCCSLLTFLVMIGGAISDYHFIAENFVYGRQSTQVDGSLQASRPNKIIIFSVGEKPVCLTKES